MRKLGLLTTTAIVAATIAFAMPAKAEEQGGWFDSMKYKVQSWFGGDTQADVSANAETEAYLDEVTIAVPPMTGEEAAAIQPAAGDYVDDVEQQINNAPTPVAPGTVGYEERSDFNTEFDGEQGSVTAFGDTPSADDLANIMPAAGDAEEVTDESVVVVESETTAEVDADTTVADEAAAEVDAAADVAAETAEEAAAAAEETAEEVESEMEETDADVDAETEVNVGVSAE